jgi:hypothetical protein
MAAGRTWLKIILVVIALGMLGMCAIAGAGIYFVRKHFNTATVSAPDALKQFEEARARFKDVQPLLDIDSNERVSQRRPIADIPTAEVKATTLVVMAWDPDDGRIVNFKVPLWVLGMGERKIDLGIGAESFDMRRLNIDVKDLERIGSVLVLDLKSSSGDRALVWTQ